MSLRWVEFPFSPTAENLARYFHWFAQKILDMTVFMNGESRIAVCSVRVHEIDTGCAETEGMEPLVMEMGNIPLSDFVFSPEILSDTGIGEVMSVLKSEDAAFSYR